MKKSKKGHPHHKLAGDMLVHDIQVPRALGMVLVLSLLLIILSILVMKGA